MTSGHVPEEVEKDVWVKTMPDYLARLPDALYSNRYSKSSYPEEDVQPPAVPRQLEKPFLNQNQVEKDDQSVLPSPAHV